MRGLLLTEGDDVGNTVQPPAEPLSRKTGQVLLLCSGGVSTYTALKNSAGISHEGLSKILDGLQRRGLILKGEGGGYTITREGQRAAQQITLASESTRFKLARKLVILQRMISPKEILTFETFRALREPPDTIRKYLALAVASSLSVAYLTPDPLPAGDELQLYEQALKVVRKFSERGQLPGARVGLLILFDLTAGFDTAIERLKLDMSSATPERRESLERILGILQDQKRRDSLLKEAADRFLKTT